MLVHWNELLGAIYLLRSFALNQSLSASVLLTFQASLFLWGRGYTVNCRVFSYDNQKYLKILLNILWRQITASTTILLFRAITLPKSRCVLEEKKYIE